jgi:hypothetical protein
MKLSEFFTSQLSLSIYISQRQFQSVFFFSFYCKNDDDGLPFHFPVIFFPLVSRFYLEFFFNILHLLSLSFLKSLLPTSQLPSTTCRFRLFTEEDS